MIAVLTCSFDKVSANVYCGYCEHCVTKAAISLVWLMIHWYTYHRQSCLHDVVAVYIRQNPSRSHCCCIDNCLDNHDPLDYCCIVDYTYPADNLCNFHFRKVTNLMHTPNWHFRLFVSIRNCRKYH